MDTPTGTNDATADRTGTTDATDGGSSIDVARDTTPTTDGPTSDTPAADGGMMDATPPTDTDARDASGDTTSTDGAASMVLTSTAFVEGAMLPSDFTCAGTNVSPPLTWTAGPPGTMSYAVELTDRTVGAVLIHSIIFDIPATTMSLPMNVEKVANPSVPAGAKQVTGYNGTTYGYLGPCPAGALHNYEFSVHALDVATLPGVTTASSRAQVDPVITTHRLAKGLLNVQSNAKTP
jgi:Raf kinase inhibitor-like YbhB/YbcL family protein